MEYLVIGGMAVAYYGDYRKSITKWGQVVEKPDIDLWYYPSYENYFKLLNALEQLGLDVKEFKEEEAPDPWKSNFQFEFEDYTLDALPIIKAPLKFWQAYARKKVVERNGVQIPFMALDDLIEEKTALGRPRDIADIENLRRNNPPAPSA
ncbi:hypothetical protein [Spirosoma harenae]